MAKDLILIIEDDRELSDIMKKYLIRDAFNVIQIYDGLLAINELKKSIPKVILLDIMLPNFDGVEILKELRDTLNIPVIIISAKSTETDKLMMFGLGADDYMTKPFSMREMVARIKGLIRRENIYYDKNEQVKTFDNLRIYSGQYKAEVNGVELFLTAKEFKLLDYLTSNKDRVYSKQQLIDYVWGFENYIDENAVCVCIARLREKLSAHDIDNIKTVWGVGYKWQE